METNIFKQIFFDENSPIVIKEVEKFCSCGDYRKDFKLFVCEGCYDVLDYIHLVLE